MRGFWSAFEKKNEQTTMYRIAFFLICFAVLPLSNLLARHIVGGGITYECVRPGVYRFTMNVYRDLNGGPNAAPLDEVAYIGVYRCPPTGCPSNFGQQSTFTEVEVVLQEVRTVAVPDYPCLIPPDIRTEAGTYTWEMALPISEQSYHITYQRCCRNVTINNLIRPDDQGSTYTVEITPEAQQLCNSSPTFRLFPPTVICANEPLEFDHGAIDLDGDQLVYEFCAPLDGGAGGAAGLDPLNYTTCDGAYPQPGCPPPYDEVTFAAPTYAFDVPLGGDPVVKIDPNTGLITGTPRIQGQFVVGVCVSEFRDGVLLSKTYRDFQFNVASCDPQVIADIREDVQISDQEYQVNSCGVTEISFVNESFQERFIREYEWTFNTGFGVETSREWEPTFAFADIGQYEGTLILNPNTECGDTALIKVNIFPDIEAEFTYEYDTCAANPVEFTNQARSGAGEIVEYAWDFGDGNQSGEPDPEHLFRSPGDIPVTLTVRDTNQCEAAVTQLVQYYPVPNLLVVAPSSFNGCAPLPVFFNNLSFPIDSTYDLDWRFGDGGSSGAISPTYVYDEAGLFTVDLSITSPIGCTVDTSFINLIQVTPSPQAGFSYSPEIPTNLDSEVQFFDESSNAIRWHWTFGDGQSSLQESPTYTFRDTGRFAVQQVVTHPSGCMDTLLQIVDVRPEVRYFLPNAFTPNGDAVNDEYRGVGMMSGARNYSMTIWNRWGQQVFASTDPNRGWNGRLNNAGQEAPAGVYVVVVTFQGPRGETFEYKEYATLVR